jgi:hypothetical protein
MKEQKLQVAMISKPIKKENLFALIKSISANSRHLLTIKQNSSS